MARETSDVSRFRGVWLASAAGALAVVVGLVGWGGCGAVTSPGPLSPGHLDAGLECASCHTATPAAGACQNCHAGHASRRSEHRRLQASGELACATCHTPHASPVSLVFAPYGSPGRALGVLGVLGPTRMAYPRAIPTVRYLAALLNELIDQNAKEA